MRNTIHPLTTATTTDLTLYRVNLFARYAELFGAGEVVLHLPAGSCGADLVTALRRLPGGAALPDTPFLAVNQSKASLDSILNPKDEIALLPPMAGG